MSPTRFRAGALTDTGQARAVNQDNLLVVDGRLFAVADGMGGHRGGEVASAVALESLADHHDEDTTASLVNAVARANDAVFQRSVHEPELRGMGTTLVALALAVGPDGRERLAMTNVGDSRAYRFREGRLVQLTEDHSLVESLVRQGRISPEEAASHPQRNIITRALGVDPQVEVDSWELPAVPGDRYLLCSDGLFNEVDAEVVAATLAGRDDPSDAAQELVRLANEGGGRDNITCVVVDVVEGGGAADEADARVAVASEPDLGPYSPPTEPTPVASVFDEAAPPPPPPPPPPSAGAGSDAGGAEVEPSAERDPPAAPADAAGGDDPPTPRHDTAPALIGAIPDHLPDDEDEPAEPPARRPRRFTWRVVVFVLALVGLAAAVVGALYYYGRNTYYVAFDADEQVTIFKGQPGGFLVWDPTVERVTAISAADLKATAAERVRSQPDQATLDDAEAFVANLCESLATGARPVECDAAADGPAATTATTAGEGEGGPGSGGGSAGSPSATTEPA